MPFTVEGFRNLVRILEEKPEWRAGLRRLILTEELLSLPEQVAALRAETERRFQEMAADISRLSAAVAKLEGGTATGSSTGRLRRLMPTDPRRPLCGESMNPPCEQP